MHPCGNADTARFGKGFEPSCDIDAITEDVPFLDHYVAHVDANAELNALVRRHRCIALGHARLQLGRPPQGIDHTAELNQQAITRRLDQPAIVRGHGRVNQLGADRLERRESAALVRADQS